MTSETATSKKGREGRNAQIPIDVDTMINISFIKDGLPFYKWLFNGITFGNYHYRCFNSFNPSSC